MKEKITIQEEMNLLTRPVHSLSDRELLDLYEFAFMTPWTERLCHSSVESSQLSECFRSTVGIIPSSADAFLLVLTRSTARFQSMQELHRRANRRGITIDMVILFARSLPTDMDSLNRYSNNDAASVREAACGTLPYDPLEHMEDDPSNEILDNNQTSAAPTVSTDTENVTVNKLTSNCIDTFSAVLSNMTSQSAEEYNGKNDHDILLQLLNSLFPDSKLRSKLAVVIACISSIQQWASKIERRISEIKALLDILDKRLKPRGSRGGSHVKGRPEKRRIFAL